MLAGAGISQAGSDYDHVRGSANCLIFRVVSQVGRRACGDWLAHILAAATCHVPREAWFRDVLFYLNFFRYLAALGTLRDSKSARNKNLNGAAIHKFHGQVFPNNDSKLFSCPHGEIGLCKFHWK